MDISHLPKPVKLLTDLVVLFIAHAIVAMPWIAGGAFGLWGFLIVLPVVALFAIFANGYFVSWWYLKRFGRTPRPPRPLKEISKDALKNVKRVLYYPGRALYRLACFTIRFIDEKFPFVARFFKFLGIALVWIVKSLFTLVLHFIFWCVSAGIVTILSVPLENFERFFSKTPFAVVGFFTILVIAAICLICACMSAAAFWWMKKKQKKNLRLGIKIFSVILLLMILAIQIPLRVFLLPKEPPAWLIFK